MHCCVVVVESESQSFHELVYGEERKLKLHAHKHNMILVYYFKMRTRCVGEPCTACTRRRPRSYYSRLLKCLSPDQNKTSASNSTHLIEDANKNKAQEELCKTIQRSLRNLNSLYSLLGWSVGGDAGFVGHPKKS